MLGVSPRALGFPDSPIAVKTAPTGSADALFVGAVLTAMAASWALRGSPVAAKAPPTEAVRAGLLWERHLTTMAAGSGQRAARYAPARSLPGPFLQVMQAGLLWEAPWRRLGYPPLRPLAKFVGPGGTRQISRTIHPSG